MRSEYVFADFVRCRFEGNGWHGIQCSAANFGTSGFSLEDSLVADNGHNGVNAYGSGEPATVHGDITRSTITGNLSWGLSTGEETYVDLDSSILFANRIDIFDPAGISSIVWCDVGDGDFAGTGGNFSADPLFRDAANGDYRLTFGSPCADAADPNTPTGLFDLTGRPRPIDGDLDTDRRADVGAHELAPLALASEPALGGRFEIETWGPGGGLARLWLSRLAPVAPQPGPYGIFELERTEASLWLVLDTTVGQPTLLTRQIPDQAAWIGQTFSFQALTDGPAAPFGLAWTNVVSFTLAAP